jgi:hypothetical protein
MNSALGEVLEEKRKDGRKEERKKGRKEERKKGKGRREGLAASMEGQQHFAAEKKRHLDG